MSKLSSVAARASSKLNYQIGKGIIRRLDYCEVCGHTADDIRKSAKLSIALLAGVGSNLYANDAPLSRIIFGHHWRGYDYPLDVWWVCGSCNLALAGKHDGSLPTPEAAKRYILDNSGLPKFLPLLS